MRFFIDLEFDIPSDQILSLGMISEDGTQEFYAVLEWHKPLDPWVLENVVPILNSKPISLEEFHVKLEAFCKKFSGMHIVANHPNDIRFFNELLINGDKGKWIKIQPLTFEVDDDLSGKGSLQLHNALADAKATREDWFKKKDFVSNEAFLDLDKL